MPTDKCGTNIHPGQLVDLFMSGMVTANVVRVDEPRITIPGQPMQGQVLVQFLVSVPYTGSKCDQMYVVHTPKATRDTGLVLPDGRRVTSPLNPVPDARPSEPEPE